MSSAIPAPPLTPAAMQVQQIVPGILTEAQRAQFEEIWLMNALSEDLPNALFLPDIDPADPDSNVMYVKNAATPERRQQLVDAAPGPLHRGLRGSGEELRGLADLLQFLVKDSPGGTPLTDIISAYVLDCGADCIIYPSARVDCGVTYRDYEVDSWWGSNVVDLEGATSVYSGHVALVSCPTAQYAGTQMTVFVDPLAASALPRR